MTNDPLFDALLMLGGIVAFFIILGIAASIAEHVAARLPHVPRARFAQHDDSDRTRGARKVC